MKAQITDDMKETRLIAAAQSMSSLQIAEITGKRHNERNFALAEVGAHNFVATSYEGCKFNLYPQKLIQTMLVSGQNRNILMLTEDGLYEVLMQSRKPIAKQFKKGVKKILREVRQTGGYIAALEICVSPKIEVTLPRPSIVAAASQPNRIVPAFFNAQTCVYNGFAPPCYGLMPVTAATGEGQRDRRDRFSSTRNANNVYNVR